MGSLDPTLTAEPSMDGESSEQAAPVTQVVAPVVIGGVSMPFWQLVALFTRCLFALTLSLVIVGLVLGVAAFFLDAILGGIFLHPRAPTGF